MSIDHKLYYQIISVVTLSTTAHATLPADATHFIFEGNDKKDTHINVGFNGTYNPTTTSWTGRLEVGVAPGQIYPLQGTGYVPKISATGSTGVHANKIACFKVVAI
jgi:hypothetical protein